MTAADWHRLTREILASGDRLGALLLQRERLHREADGRPLDTRPTPPP